MIPKCELRSAKKNKKLHVKYNALTATFSIDICKQIYVISRRHDYLCLDLSDVYVDDFVRTKYVDAIIKLIDYGLLNY